MATSLSELRKNKSQMFDKISKDLDKKGSFTKEEDTRFWKLERDKTGNGSAIIRFLPPVNGDELPWVRKYSYGFQGPSGKWYINDSPSTINKEDPVMELNRELYNSKDPVKVEQAKKQKRRTSFISNVYVVKDPAHPENEGKVFLFSYGKKIHEMITMKAKPEFEDDTPLYVWDLDNGADFRIRIRTVEKYPNYDSSEFSSPSAFLGGDDDKLQAVIDVMHRLGDFTDPSKFKPYAVLEAEMKRALGDEAPVRSALDRMNDDNNDESTSKPAAGAPKLREKEVVAEKKPVAPPTKVVAAAAEGEDDMAYFKSLLEDI